MAHPGGVAAYYRGGSDRTSLRSVDVTSVGQWGQEPPAAKIHGTIAGDEIFALRRDGAGRVQLVR